MTDLRSVAIVGAGAMGCFFAARLTESGAAVTLIDIDAARLAALVRDGVTVSDDRGERVVKVGAAKATEVAGPVDLVVLFTKSMHSSAAIASVVHLASPETWALTLQNGLGNAEVMAEVFAPERILAGVTNVPADLQGPTRVASHGAGQITLGGFVASAKGGAEPVAALLRRAGLTVTVDENVAAAIWDKVAFNAALNALAAITLLPNGGLDCPAGRRVAASVVGEVVAVAAAKGIRLERGRIEARIDYALASHRTHKASMLQDRLAGRRTEIEQINGAIVWEAEAVGLQAPVNATLADLVRMIEAPPAGVSIPR
ncbi:MAG: ketopantoate reductase family protein [Hyphomonadaceae bacterium]|nr:ketopantoate reductase family protein [Hyphomonadaceae bacterium]